MIRKHLAPNHGASKPQKHFTNACLQLPQPSVLQAPCNFYISVCVDNLQEMVMVVSGIGYSTRRNMAVQCWAGLVSYDE